MTTQESKAMSIGDWIITFIILAIPLVGIIMQFVWAFSSETQPSKKTFCQASLIIFAIFFVLTFVFVFALGGMAAIMEAQQKSGGGGGL